MLATPPPSSAYSIQINKPPYSFEKPKLDKLIKWIYTKYNRTELRIKQIVCEEVNKVQLMSNRYVKDPPLICTPENILTRKRDIEYRTAKGLIAMFLIYFHGMSYSQVGKVIDRDHSTINNIRHNLSNYCKYDQKYRNLLASIFDRFDMISSERIEFYVFLDEKDLRLRSK